MPIKRDLDGVYFRVMRDGKGVNLCWTDLCWEDRTEFARKNNNEGWLIRMIQLMNEYYEKCKLADKEIQAKKLGMSYGQYVAFADGLGRL
jgi:hypothetical protein